MNASVSTQAICASKAHNKKIQENISLRLLSGKSLIFLLCLPFWPNGTVMYTLSLHSWKGYLHCIFNEFVPHAINHQLWNVCEGIDIIIEGINLVNEEHPYWSSGLWLFKSNTGILAVFCRIITISLANSHWVWINNNILKTSEEFLLHFKKYPCVCNFQCQESKYCEHLW